MLETLQTAPGFLLSFHAADFQSPPSEKRNFKAWVRGYIAPATDGYQHAAASREDPGAVVPVPNKGTPVLRFYQMPQSACPPLKVFVFAFSLSFFYS